MSDEAKLSNAEFILLYSGRAASFPLAFYEALDRLEAAEARIARYKERDALCGNCHQQTRQTPCAKCGTVRP